jgi:hypothetical protein
MYGAGSQRLCDERDREKHGVFNFLAERPALAKRVEESRSLASASLGMTERGIRCRLAIPGYQMRTRSAGAR